MPYIDIKVATEHLSEVQVSELASGVTEIMAKVLNKQRDLVAVNVQAQDAGGWVIGGKSLEGHKVSSVFITALITAGTNNAAQKAEAMTQLWSLSTAQLGELAEASYIVIQEVAASDWGYSGRTQQFRQEQRS